MVTTIAANNMEQLHQDILDGEVEPPARFSKLGREYNRWLRDSKKQADFLDRQRRRAGGGVPVRKETAFVAIRARGLIGSTAGFSVVRSGPPEWQTTTSLGCGFKPDVVGAAAPVVGTSLGRHVSTGDEVACDPLAWFREGIIANP